MAILGRMHRDGSQSRGRVGRRAKVAAFAQRSVLMLLASLCVVMTFAPVAKAQRAADVNKLKAAFIYQFSNFVDWPSEAFELDDSPFVIGVVGNKDLREILKSAVRGKSVDGHPLEIKSFESSGDPSSCHILFIGKTEKQHVQGILDLCSDKPVLTIGDSEDFTDKGGVILLYEERNKLRIEINTDAADRAELSISSRLLGLGRLVRDTD